MSELSDIIEAHGEKFDALREVYFSPNAFVEFLIVDDATNDFETIYELRSSWYLNYSESRSATAAVFKSGSPVSKLSIAKGRDDENFIEAINRATHFRVESEVYVIRPNETLPPQGEEPVWRLYCERHSSRSQFSLI